MLLTPSYLSQPHDCIPHLIFLSSNTNYYHYRADIIFRRPRYHCPPLSLPSYLNRPSVQFQTRARVGIESQTAITELTRRQYDNLYEYLYVTQSELAIIYSWTLSNLSTLDFFSTTRNNFANILPFLDFVSDPFLLRANDPKFIEEATETRGEGNSLFEKSIKQVAAP